MSLSIHILHLPSKTGTKDRFIRIPMYVFLICDTFVIENVLSNIIPCPLLRILAAWAGIPYSWNSEICDKKVSYFSPFLLSVCYNMLRPWKLDFPFFVSALVVGFCIPVCIYNQYM